jgi:Gpi18-like mannosyltransferase
MIGWSTGTLPAGELVDSVEGRFARWDSGYYLRIAQYGYGPDGIERAFLPLYPILIYFLSNSLGLSLLWSGWIISVTCFIGAGLLLYQWVQIDYGSEKALWSVIWLCAFPMSFFFSSLYAESLFLLTSLAAIYFARRGQFIGSGLAIALAGATRPPAFLLVIPYLLEFYRQHDFRWTQYFKFAIGMLLAPLGIFAYLLFLGRQTGNSNILTVYTSLYAAGSKRSITYPWISLLDGIKAAIFGTNINLDWFSRAFVWQDLIYAVLALSLAIWSVYHFRSSISIFMVCSVLFLFANHGPYGYAFFSISRYLAVLFPIYPIIVLVTINLPGRYRLPILALSIGMLVLLSAWFATGRWVA